MRKALICLNKKPAAYFTEYDRRHYEIEYLENYEGLPISLTLPVNQKYSFDQFPAVIEGLLPEGMMLDRLLKNNKIDRDDFFQQFLITGKDMVGAITVKEINDE